MHDVESQIALGVGGCWSDHADGHGRSGGLRAPNAERTGTIRRAAGVPFGALGAFLGVWLRGMASDVYFQIGLLVVAGLAAKNAILIVEFASELRAQGRSIRDAAIEPARERFRPILMTSFAFILGVGPLLVARAARGRRAGTRSAPACSSGCSPPP